MTTNSPQRNLTEGDHGAAAAVDRFTQQGVSQQQKQLSDKIFNPLAHIADFENRFPLQMEMFRIVGMHPIDNRPGAHGVVVTNPYTNQPATDNYSNIGEHCISVAFGAQVIANELLRRGVLVQPQVEQIVERSLIHDLNKPFETMRRDEERRIKKLEENEQLSKADSVEFSQVYSQSAYDMLQPRLKNIGLSDQQAAYLISAGSETGHNSLKFFVEKGFMRNLASRQEHLATSIVHLVDSMTYTSIPQAGEAVVTEFLVSGDRMARSKFLEKYPFLWIEGLAEGKAGEVVVVKGESMLEPGQEWIDNYAAIQLRVAYSISQMLQSLIASHELGNPEEFVRDLINSRID